jgi:N-acetylglucosamine kinase-like BadF-type ATPase
VSQVAVFIGVDGGGTKTQVMAIHSRQRRAVSVIGGASNPHNVGFTRALEEVLGLVEQALTALGAGSDQLAALSACLAGVDRPEQVERLRDVLSQRLPGCAIEVANDALAALTAGTEGEPGVVLIAGTGSIAVGEDLDGRVVRAGGYGNLIGDEGSGFDLGRRGLMAAIQGCEGRGPKTALWPRAARMFGIDSVQEIISKVYEAEHPVGTVASFAREVLACADEDGDPVAASILDIAVDHQRRLVEAVFQQLSPRLPRRVVLAGGLFTHGDVLSRRLAARAPHLEFVTLRHSAAAGAVLRAMRAVAAGRPTPGLAGEAAPAESSGLPQADEPADAAAWTVLWREALATVEGDGSARSTIVSSS